MSIEEHIKSLRRDYSGKSLDEREIDPDPLKQFQAWLEEAVKSEISDPHAMVVATVSKNGRPSARVVLLRGFEKKGLVFYTNYKSQKGAEVQQNPKVAAVFFWSELARQVRIEGSVEKVDGGISDGYFNSRPRESQIAAWASDQSETISSRAELDRRYEEYEKKFSGRPVPRPENWGGLVILPASYEFWQGRPNRLHDRIIYSRDAAGEWTTRRLAP